MRPLNAGWHVTWAGAGRTLPARVPGYVQHDLHDAGLLPDPFFRDNEKIWQPWCDRDYTYCCTFDTDDKLLACAQVQLVFDGIDTVAEVWLNDVKLAYVDNMFRTWRFPVREFLRREGNELRVVLHSPVRVCAQRESRLKDTSPVLRIPLDPRRHLRKMACSFGWDWGITLPLSGIWKEVRLEGWTTARLAEVWHATTHVDTHAARIEGGVRIVRAAPCACSVHVSLLAPNGATQELTLPLPEHADTAYFAFHIPSPALWWPNGLGTQSRYLFNARLITNGNLVSHCHHYIGIRRIELVQEPDRFGQSFYFRVNGVPVFAKGANWIPADAILSRLTPADYRRLLHAARAAHMNTIRVWGGGIYENDIFYDLCDEFGLMVWQDLMTACTLVPTYREFLESVGCEVRDAVARLRHHACVALWCGNNECEETLIWRNADEACRREYDFLYNEYLRGVVNLGDPSRSYWPSSPHSPRSLNPHRQDCGDTHYWGVWHGDQPFEAYLSRTDRFMSEFGFQSFPDSHTVARYTLPEDRTLDSPIMRFHQRSGEHGNRRIVETISARYTLPQHFPDQLMLSQVVQAEAVRIGVEHWRRHRKDCQCMGALYWQLNDNWPVASWSSIDYFGRWKALHYAAREFFAPLLLSPYCENESVHVTLVNDHLQSRRGRLTWAVRTYAGRVITRGALRALVSPGDATHVWSAPVAELLGTLRPHQCYLVCEWRDRHGVTRRVMPFSSFRDAQLRDPQLQLHHAGREVRVRATRFAAYVCLSCNDPSLQFSDNFFHLLPREERVVRLVPVRDELAEEAYSSANVQVRSLYELCRAALSCPPTPVPSP
ncbi:MAG: glycoside hydrolase family 2 protein [bacterium]|nr:glycoside hydrolase family 2 protein [bacterium]